ncbi:MAG: polysaccharide deacetylase family protein, partial [Actinomycetota bacterium]|nr:polysaccharide deacetylase family protein [Actinomycetota bacterium]
MSRGFRPLVLCYHAVTDGWDHALAIGPAELERQVQKLVGRGWRPASLADALARGGRALHVTFDDAFRSVSRAVPALERLGVPATVFACSAYARDGRPLDVPELAADAARLPNELATMPWDDLRALAERGIEIGSHTVSHPRLTTVSDARLERELRESREHLEDELGRPCRFLAYPYGDEDGRVHAAAARAGYDAAFALPGRESPVNPFALPRVGIYRDNSRLKVLLKT